MTRTILGKRTAGIILGLCFLALALVQAQGPPAPPSPPSSKSQDPLNRDSPQSSVYSFLEACHTRNYNRAAKYFDLRKLPAQSRLNEGQQLAQQLEQILDRDVQFDVASLSRSSEGERSGGLPPSRERVASFKDADGRIIELQLERVPLRSGISVWLFSSDSVALIPRIARITSDSPLEKHMPDALVNWKLVDTSLWRWIALALMALAFAAFSKLLSRLVLLPLEPLLKRFAQESGAVGAFIGPLRIMVWVALFRAGVEWAGPSALLRLYLSRGITLLFFFGLALLAAAIVDLAHNRLRQVMEARHSAFSYSALPVVSRLVKMTIFLLAITATLSDWGYNTTTILAGLGVGGLAIALAAQKTIENLFGGVAVVSDRPVFVGDVCRFGDRVGTVEDIGLRSTRLRTPDRTLVTVPNAQFSSMTLENLSKRDKILFHFTLNLRRDTTSDQVRALLGSITKILTDHKKVQEGSLPVRFVGVGTYSLDLEVFAYVLTRDGDEFLQIQQDLLLSILREVEAAGTALAIPIQASVSYSSGDARGTSSAPKPALVASSKG